MKRSPDNLAEKPYDILVVGGGAYGAAAAREAALRGLSVAVIDARDFCSATSANSLKIIHGGLRYLQQLDVVRLRESVVERRNLMRIAPHLVHPLRCMMPTRGHFMKGKEAMFCGLTLNAMLSCDRNRLADPEKTIPRGNVISLSECARILPGLDMTPFNGGAVWYDAYAYNTERLVIATVRSAVESGADAANYVRMTGFLRSGNTITGIRAVDVLSGNELEIQAKLVINNTGAWINDTLALPGGLPPLEDVSLALGMNIIADRLLIADYAAGLSFAPADNQNERLLFFMPWRGRTLAGTTYRPHTGTANELSVTDEDIDHLLADLNGAYPPGNLTRDNIAMLHAGLLPSTGVNRKTGEPELMRHSRIIDHARRDNVPGLLSVLGVKYTTARHMAAQTIQMAATVLGLRTNHPARSAVKALPGGDIPNFTRFIEEAAAQHAPAIDQDMIERLVYNYGSDYSAVLELGAGPVAGLISGEILHAIRHEMAQTLSDVIFRRTDLASAGIPPEDALRDCAKVMAAELGWDAPRTELEIDATRRSLFPGHSPDSSPQARPS